MKTTVLVTIDQFPSEISFQNGLCIFGEMNNQTIALYSPSADDPLILQDFSTYQKNGFEPQKMICARPEVSAILKRHIRHEIPTKIFLPSAPITLQLLPSGVMRFPSLKHISPPSPIKVFILDDSPAMQQLLKRALVQRSFDVIGLSKHPHEALELLSRLQPDFLTVDLLMPDLTGDLFLKKLPKLIPSIIVSSLSREESHLVLQALEAGALDYIQKPNSSQFDDFADSLAFKILSFSQNSSVLDFHQQTQSKHLKDSLTPFYDLILIGSSTGGTEALKTIFETLPPLFPPIVVAQHLPEFYTLAFAQRLSQQLNLSVQEVQGLTPLNHSSIYIIRGGSNGCILKKGSRLFVDLTSTENSVFIPSVDTLFSSAASLDLGSRLVAIVLTGMGSDGAEGALALSQTRARILSQSQRSCVVYGMPRAIQRLKIDEAQLDPGDIFPYLARQISPPTSSSAS